MSGNTQSADESTREHGLGSEILRTTTPSTKLVTIYMGVLAVVGLGLGVYFLTNPGALGEQGYGEIAGWVVLLLTVAGLVRLTVAYLVLQRTEYHVTTDSVRREYELFYSEQSRELPLSKIRGVELRRGRLQAMLGFGTVSFLAAGTNRSIGYIDFDNTDQPHELRATVLELLDDEPDRTPVSKSTTAGTNSEQESDAPRGEAAEADANPN
ncbi:PH domain-containing protein [Haloarchaeobius sp. DFWS5]|uniref:PH domain-containing protein n=1 Tax=Haloarchaeobius sp. DFWS5 TaxID=3446114 RepID=UPI003EB8EA1F